MFKKKFNPEGRSCEECVFVVVDATGVPVTYSCELDQGRVQQESYCEAFLDWYESAERDLPTSAHEKAMVLAVKQSTYRENFLDQLR